jgi:hypothetical protein
MIGERSMSLRVFQDAGAGSCVHLGRAHGLSPPIAPRIALSGKLMAVKTNGTTEKIARV